MGHSQSVVALTIMTRGLSFRLWLEARLLKEIFIKSRIEAAQIPQISQST